MGAWQVSDSCCPELGGFMPKPIILTADVVQVSNSAPAKQDKIAIFIPDHNILLNGGDQIPIFLPSYSPSLSLKQLIVKEFLGLLWGFFFFSSLPPVFSSFCLVLCSCCFLSFFFYVDTEPHNCIMTVVGSNVSMLFCHLLSLSRNSVYCYMSGMVHDTSVS